MNEDDLLDQLRSISMEPLADRDELLRQLGRDSPALKDKIRSWRQRGWLLWRAVEGALSAAVERNDISEDEKTEARQEAHKVSAAIEVISEHPSGLVSRQLAFDLATNSIFVGLRAGLTPEQLEKFRQQWFSAQQRARGKRSGENRRSERPWPPHAKERAHHFRTKHKSWSRPRIANAILSEWQSTSQIANPSYDQLLDYVKELELSGELPLRTGKSQA